MLRIAKITPESYVDGPGKRAVLHFQGCSIRCRGCQNKHLWPRYGGDGASGLAVAKSLLETGLPITITGGEPFDQAGELSALLAYIRARAPGRHIVVYTGYTFDELVASHLHHYAVLSALADTDILVDGPYARELDAPDMQYRGSSNQRVIDMRATLRLSAREILTRGPVDISGEWDVPELILTEDGDLLGASPVIDEFSSIGAPTSTRRCGEA